MQTYDYSVSFRIRHPSLEPYEITREFLMEPGRMWKAGDARATPKGQPLTGTYKETYWYTNFCSNVTNTDESLPAALARFIDTLRAHKQFLLKLRHEGGSAEFFVGIFGMEQFGFEFEPVLLADLASMGMTLSLDIYPVRQRS
jgi:hypothetical protein